jgi:serine/threonine protein kinase
MTCRIDSSVLGFKSESARGSQGLAKSRSVQAKVLDFGLAKLLPQAGAEVAPEATRSLVDDSNLTSPGVALGTVAYMSPEQVPGETPSRATASGDTLIATSRPSRVVPRAIHLAHRPHQSARRSRTAQV